VRSQQLISYHNDKLTLTEQRRELDPLESLNRMQMQREAVADPQLEATLQSMSRLPDADRSAEVRHPQESQATLSSSTAPAARPRLSDGRPRPEKGVRMVQVYTAKATREYTPTSRPIARTRRTPTSRSRP
jgi:hypothetical protein